MQKPLVMSTEKTMSHEESLRIADEMIGVSRKGFLKQSFYFLLWGWLLILAGVSVFVLQQIDFAYPYIVWPLVGVIGGIVAGVHGKRASQNLPAATVADMSIGAVWMGFGISLFLFIVALVMNGVSPDSIIILLTGLPTFATGMILKFRPLVLGGVLFWIIGFASFFIPAEFSSLAFSVAILLGYLLPGFALKSAERNGSL